MTDPTVDALAAIGMVLEVHDAMQSMVREDGLPAEAVDPAHGFAAALADAGYVVVRAEEKWAPAHPFDPACPWCVAVAKPWSNNPVQHLYAGENLAVCGAEVGDPCQKCHE